RTDGVDDVPRLQPMPAGDLGRAGVAAVERRAFRAQAGARGAMDGAVDTATAEKLAVRRIDDGVDVERGDVGDDDVEPRRADRGGQIAHAAIISPPYRRDLR